jgi:hypothetical protein
MGIDTHKHILMPTTESVVYFYLKFGEEHFKIGAKGLVVETGTKEDHPNLCSTNLVVLVPSFIQFDFVSMDIQKANIPEELAHCEFLLERVLLRL